MQRLPALNLKTSTRSTVLKFVSKHDDGDREVFVFEESKEKPKAGSHPQISFGRYKNSKEGSMLLSEFSGPMHLGLRDAIVKISFSQLVAVKVTETRMNWDEKEHRFVEAKDNAAPESLSPLSEEPKKTANGPTVSLLDGKLKIDIPADFSRDP